MHTSEIATYDLPAELTIYQIGEFRDALLTWVTQNASKRDTLELSAREVVEIDGAGLQLLASLSNMEHGWRLVEASPRFAEACHTLGLSSWVDPRHVKIIEPGAAA